MGMKVPIYVPERSLGSKTPADQVGIDLLSGPAKAMQGFGTALEDAGTKVAAVSARNVIAEQKRLKEIEHKSELRRKAEQNLAIDADFAQRTELTLEQMKIDFEQTKDRPDGFAGRFMSNHREKIREVFDSFNELDPDYAVAWKHRMVQMESHLWSQAMKYEVDGRIAKQDSQIDGIVRTWSNSFQNNPVDIETVRDVISMIDTDIRNLPNMDQTHAKTLIINAKQQLAESAVRGYLNIEQYQLAKDILKTGYFDDYLHPDQKQTLLNNAEQGLKNQGTAVTYEVKEGLQSHISSIVENGIGNQNLDRTFAASKLHPNEWAKFLDDEKMAKDLYKAKSKLDTLPLDKIGDYVAKLKPTDPSDRYFADKQKVHNLLEQMAAQIQAEAIKDPVGYAMRKVQDLGGKRKADPYFHEMVSGESTFNSPETFRQVQDHFYNLLNKTQAYIKDHNVPTEGRMVPNAMIDRDVKMIQSMEPDKVGDFLNNQKKLWGNYFSGYWRDLCKYGKLPTQYKMAMFAEGTPYEPLVVNAIRMKDEDVKRVFPKESDYSHIHEATISQLQPFIKIVNMGSPSGISAGEVADIAHVLTKMTGIKYGGATTKSAPNKLASEMVDGFIMDRFHLTDTYAVPKMLEDNRVLIDRPQLRTIRDRLDQLKTPEEMTKLGFKPLITENGKLVNDDFKRKTMLRSYAANAYWVSNENFDGVYLMYNYGAFPDYIMSTDGKKYEVKFNDLLQGGGKEITPRRTSPFKTYQPWSR